MNAILRALRVSFVVLRVNKIIHRAEQTPGVGDGPPFTVGEFLVAAILKLQALRDVNLISVLFVIRKGPQRRFGHEQHEGHEEKPCSRGGQNMQGLRGTSRRSRDCGAGFFGW